MGNHILTFVTALAIQTSPESGPVPFQAPIQKFGFVGLLAVRQAVSLLHSRWCDRPFDFKQSYCGDFSITSHHFSSSLCHLLLNLHSAMGPPVQAFFFLDVFTPECLCGFETTGLNYMVVQHYIPADWNLEISN